MEHSYIQGAVHFVSKLHGLIVSQPLEADEEERTYMTLVRKAEAIQVGNPDIGASLLDPSICSDLTTHLFIHNCPG